MFRHALPDTVYLKPRAGRMAWLLTAVRRWLKPRIYWAISFFVSLLLLAGCSQKPSHIRLSQSQFQQTVNAGFLAPQIRTFDLQPLMMIQLYMNTPKVDLDKPDGRMAFEIHGRLDAQLIGGQVTEPLPVFFMGKAGLAYNAEDQAIYMSEVELDDMQVDLDIALFRTMIFSQFQTILKDELERIALIALPQVPELQDNLGKLKNKGEVSISIKEGNVILSALSPE